MSLNKTVKPQMTNFRYSVNIIRFLPSKALRRLLHRKSFRLKFRVRILCMKNTLEHIHSGDHFDQQELLKCPEDQVQGSIGT